MFKDVVYMKVLYMIKVKIKTSIIKVLYNVLMASPRRRLGDKALPCFGPPRHFSPPRRLGGGDSPQLALTP